ncbi:MAG: hypothetical protein ACP5VC_14935 [Bryobacteraceae bacterium]
MEEILNTGSRKHDVSKLHFVLSLARSSRGQVYRDFINSPLSLANGMPTTLASKCLIPRALIFPLRPLLPAADPGGVAW